MKTLREELQRRDGRTKAVSPSVTGGSPILRVRQKTTQGKRKARILSTSSSGKEEERHDVVPPGCLSRTPLPLSPTGEGYGSHATDIHPTKIKRVTGGIATSPRGPKSQGIARRLEEARVLSVEEEAGALDMEIIRQIDALMAKRDRLRHGMKCFRDTSPVQSREREQGTTSPPRHTMDQSTMRTPLPSPTAAGAPSKDDGPWKKCKTNKKPAREPTFMASGNRTEPVQVWQNPLAQWVPQTTTVGGSRTSQDPTNTYNTGQR